MIDIGSKLKNIDYQIPNSSSDSLIFKAKYIPDKDEIKFYKDSEWASDGYNVYIKAYDNNNKGLEYESKVYEYLKQNNEKSQIIDDLFILPVQIYKDINIFSIFPEDKIKESIILTKKKINKDFDIYAKSLNNLNNSINNKDFSKKFNCIITKTYTSLHTLYDTLIELKPDITNTKELIFQSFYAVYIMRTKLNMMHNDLHFGNILVKYRKKPYLLTYSFDNKYYYMESNYKLRIYDFDNSYVHKSNNDTLDRVFCSKYNFCNKLSNKDIFSLIYTWFKENSYVFTLTQQETINKLINKLHIERGRVNRNVNTLYCNYNTMTISECELPNELDELLNPSDILSNLIEKYKNILKPCDHKLNDDISVKESKSYYKLINENKKCLYRVQSETDIKYTYKKYLKYKNKYVKLKNSL